MSEYIRRRSPGGTFFFTIRLAARASDLLVRDIATLRHVMRATKQRHPFDIDAIVVLPSVIHTVWTLPEGDTDYPNRVGMLKSKFSRSQPMPAHRTLTQIKRGEKGIWQRRYWEHQIRDTADFERHRALIYQSPVHAGLCATPQDWPHTSLHRDVTKGAVAPAPLGHGAARLHLTHPAHNARPDDCAERMM
jgi:putative transposase